MTIKQAIEKAIENGWGGKWEKKPIIEILENKLVGFSYPEAFGRGYGVKLSLYDILHQPLFWQSLGKTMGWDESESISMDIGGHLDITEYEKWKDEWHSFIDHLAVGGTAESFFAEL